MGDMFKLLLREFYDHADWTPSIAAHFKAHGIDDKLVLAHAGTAALLPCVFDGNGYFDLDPEGETCLVFEVLDEDAATTVDLCASSIADPRRFGSAVGGIPVLGMTNVTNPASWAFGKVLPVFRRPLSWLRAGCQGVVILHHSGAADCLARKLGNLLAEDEAHARDLRSMLCTPPVDPSSILYPRSAMRRTAA